MYQCPANCHSPAPGRKSAEERRSELKLYCVRFTSRHSTRTFPTQENHQQEMPYQSHQVRDDQDNEEQTGKEEQETKE